MGFHPAIFWAWVVVIAESVGGLGVLGGLLTRPAALGIVIDVAVAIIEVHGKNGFFLSNGGYEYPMMLLAAALAILILGAGDFSLDALIARWLKSRRRAKTGNRTPSGV